MKSFTRAPISVIFSIFLAVVFLPQESYCEDQLTFLQNELVVAKEKLNDSESAKNLLQKDYQNLMNKLAILIEKDQQYQKSVQQKEEALLQCQKGFSAKLQKQAHGYSKEIEQLRKYNEELLSTSEVIYKTAQYEKEPLTNQLQKILWDLDQAHLKSSELKAQMKQYEKLEGLIEEYKSELFRMENTLEKSAKMRKQAEIERQALLDEKRVWEKDQRKMKEELARQKDDLLWAGKEYEVQFRVERQQLIEKIKDLEGRIRGQGEGYQAKSIDSDRLQEKMKILESGHKDRKNDNQDALSLRQEASYIEKRADYRK